MSCIVILYGKKDFNKLNIINQIMESIKLSYIDWDNKFNNIEFKDLILSDIIKKNSILIEAENLDISELNMFRDISKINNYQLIIRFVIENGIEKRYSSNKWLIEYCQKNNINCKKI